MKYAAVIVVLALAGRLAAQQLNPVYTDDSTTAKETLVRAGEIAAAGNVAEAVREMQRLLDEQPDRVVESEPDLFVSVRSRVHAALLADPKLLEQYRLAETARAGRLLDSGDFAAVERSRLLTEPGLEAALRVAQSQMESARFHAALITLGQLDPHPDLAGAGAARAAPLARTLSRYLPAAGALAQRWWSRAGLGAWEDAPAFPAPPCVGLDQRGFVSAAQPLRAEGLPVQPLWTSQIEPQEMPLEPGEAMMRAEQREELGGGLWVFPTAVEDTIYVNDGVFVAARDRFTLQTKWSVRPVSAEGSADPWAPRRANVATRMVEDSCTVTVQCHTVIAAMGLAHSGDREGEPGLFAIDAHTGRVIWSALLPRLDAQLDGAVVRGPAMIDGDTVIVAARRASQGRRIVGSYLVGLSLNDGSLRWVRQVGSAGAIPWGGRGDQRVNSAPLLDSGVVYCVDNLGVIGAVEAATGRPVWVRRAPTPAMGGGIVTEASAPWHWTMPIADGASVVLLSPDRSEVLRLDRATGRVVARRAAPDLGSPSYLLRVGDRLATVGMDGIFSVPMAEFEKARPVRVVPMRGNFLRGRVVVAGDRLLAPVAEGVAELDPVNPVADPPIRKLDRVGNVLPLESQLLVIDSTNLHSYLTYSVAQRLLQQRMDAAPDDPEPAVTFADLAYRSGHPEQIAPAADRALAAIEKNATGDRMRLTRRRLFSVLRTMVEASQDRSQVAPEPLPAARFGTRPTRPARELPALETKWLTLVVERLGRAAETPDERVSYLMALGRLHDADGRPAMAAEAYQTVLGDAVLGAASWQGATASVRADLEATRRVRQLLLDRGPAAYAPFEAQAAAELSALGPNAPAPALERLARRFPAAVATARAWSKLADLEEAAGRDQGALAALREALVTVETAHTAGVEMEPGLFGEVAGRLAGKLQRVEQFFAAAQLLTRLQAQYPELALTDRGAALDGASAARELLARLPGQRRLPRVGHELTGEVQALPGWQIMPARSKSGDTRSAEHLMMIAPGDARVALWGAATGAQPVAAGSSPLVQTLWAREFRSGRAPELLRLDADSVYLFWEWTEGGQGPAVERISAVGGETRWRTDPFRGLFASDPELDRRISSVMTFETPIDGTVRLRDVLVSMDEGVMAMVERTGRAAVFERDSGRMLWRGVVPVAQVHDVAVGAGMLAVLGSAPGGNEDRALRPAVSVMDVRTGQLVRTIAPLAGKARWLRIAGEQAGASLVVGVDSEVACYDLGRGDKRWSINDQTASGTLEAWVFGDRLYLLDRMRNVWQANLVTGQVLRQPLETYEHLQGSGLIEATAVGTDRVAFATERGVCIFDPSGKLVGIDAATGQEADEGALTIPVQSGSYFVMAEVGQRQNDSGRNIHNLHVVDAGSGLLRATRPLILDQPPRAIALLDGRIVVGAGGSAIVYSAPQADR